MDAVLPYFGFFHAENFWPGASLVLFAALTLAYTGMAFWSWAILILLSEYLFGAPFEVMGGTAVVLTFFMIRPLRTMLISGPIMNFMKKGFLPKISDTEKIALEAGVVWSEAELFSGKPNFKKIVADQPAPQLSPEEKAFLDGPVDELCQMIDDWNFWRTREMPAEAMKFIKEKGFLGMIIPKEYGGLGFSAYAHSEVIMKLSTRSIATSITVMVPNSLGPAELLIHYGTDKQKKHHLPRLAKGEDVPCFGLTEPQAGSDAGSITSSGVLFKDKATGKIQIRLNWRKRWITLAAISNTIGLAFRLRDPENFLGKGEDVGITCALIPSKTPGVVIGRRHDPLGVPFYNCPTEGHDVVVDAEEAIIGGTAGAGRGWQMLMECLAAGRGISLPGQSTGGLKYAARVSSNHALIRKQFGVSIGRFEGVEEPLARITGSAYMIEAMRRYTLTALDQGVKPAVVTAIAKFTSTESFRRGVNDAMDILGGAGISMGPKNLMAAPYIAAPIGITVEGANILTRTLIIFGQGALRAHPYAFREVEAAEKGDAAAFDAAFWGHIGHVVRNLVRAKLLSLTRGHLAFTPGQGGTRRHYQRLAWVSATFAIMADVSMALLGGNLKFKEKITGRFADILSNMYIATAVLHRYKSEGYQKEDKIYVDYSMDVLFNSIHEAFDGLYANFDVPVIGLLFKGPVRWLNNLNRFGKNPSDHLGHLVAQSVMRDTAQRDRVTDGIFIPKKADDALARQELAFKTIARSEQTESKIRKAVKAKTIPKLKGAELVEAALKAGVISAEEAKEMIVAEQLRWETIQVDDFSEDEFRSRKAMERSSGSATAGSPASFVASGRGHN